MGLRESEGKPPRGGNLLRERMHIPKTPWSSPMLNDAEKLFEEKGSVSFHWGRHHRQRGSELGLTERQLGLDMLEWGRTGTPDNRWEYVSRSRRWVSALV